MVAKAGGRRAETKMTLVQPALPRECPRWLAGDGALGDELLRVTAWWDQNGIWRVRGRFPRMECCPPCGMASPPPSWPAPRPVCPAAGRLRVGPASVYAGRRAREKREDAARREHTLSWKIPFQSDCPTNSLLLFIILIPLA